MNFAESATPVSWVVGGTVGLGPYVCKMLSELGTKVICIESRILSSFPHPSYIFCILQEKEGDSLELFEALSERIRQFLEIARETDAKFLLICGDGPTSRFVGKLVSQWGKVYGVDERRVIIDKLYQPKVPVQDVVNGILAAMFGAGTKGREFTFGSVVPPSLQDFVSKTSPPEVSTSNKKRKIKLSDRVPKLLLGFVGALFVVAIPFILLFLSGGLLILGEKEIKNGNFITSKKIAEISESLFATSNKIFSRASGVFLIENKVLQLTKISYKGILASRVLGKASLVGTLGGKVTSGIFGNSEISVSDFTKISGEVEDLALSVEFAKAELKDDKVFGDFPSLFRLANLFQKAPKLLGFEGKKTYLVLFQNNMELRPTGGFIGSFGLLSFENGRISDVKIHDVYEADGQLKGHVEPPEKLKEYLGEASWYLRDSNWSPDFPTTASRAEWFLDKETGQKVDGVIAVDLEFAKKLIGLVGDVEVGDFGEKVTTDNFYEVVERRSEVGSFPGSTQKSDFLTALNANLIDKISFSVRSGQKAVALSQILFGAMREEHLLIFLNEKEAQEEVRELGWEGGIKSAKCKVKNAKCTEDSLLIVDTNVGVNKANYYLSRNFLLDVDILPDSINHRLSTTFVNRAKQEKDRYKTYLRFYVPSGAKNFSVNIVNETTGEKENVQPDSSQEKGKDVYGVLVEIPSGVTIRVVSSWDLASGRKPFSSLTFLWQKQPGTLEDPLVLRFHNLGEFGFKLLPKANLTTEGIVGYTTNLKDDLKVDLSL